MAAKTDLSSAHRRARSCHPPTWFLSRGREKGRLLADLHHLARFAGALHTAIKKGRGAHTFSCGRRCPAGADEGIRCAPWPANCPHPAVPARPRKRGSPRSPREKERRPRRVCNSTVKRAKVWGFDTGLLGADGAPVYHDHGGCREGQWWEGHGESGRAEADGERKNQGHKSSYRWQTLGICLLCGRVRRGVCAEIVPARTNDIHGVGF